MKTTVDNTASLSTAGTPPVHPEFRGAIIDLDGTLLDSLPFWENLASDYLRDHGVVPAADLRRRIESMELPGASRYLKEAYSLSYTAEEICRELTERLHEIYYSKARFFPGAADFLRRLHGEGVRMALFTATPKDLASRALERHGVLSLFDYIVSTRDIPYEKSSPEGYLHVLKLLGTSAEQTVVYEDAPYAIAGAIQTGMKVFDRIPVDTKEKHMKTVLTIAGSDTIGGAGIQADLKTMCAHGVYGMSVLAALTAQNTLGVQAIHTPPVSFIKQEIDSVFSDIRPDAVKIGMLANAEIIEAVAERLAFWKATNIVLDPVMVSTSKHRLLEASAERALITTLLPIATLITPNLPEAAVLAQVPDIHTREEMSQAARIIASNGNSAVLVKGGHLEECADDLLLVDGKEHWFSSRHIETENTHGTGCTLSSAIASNLALGFDLATAVKNSKEYITSALEHDPHLGHGNGPLNHMYRLG